MHRNEQTGRLGNGEGHCTIGSKLWFAVERPIRGLPSRRWHAVPGRCGAVWQGSECARLHLYCALVPALRALPLGAAQDTSPRGQRKLNRAGGGACSGIRTKRSTKWTKRQEGDDRRNGRRREVQESQCRPTPEVTVNIRRGPVASIVQRRDALLYGRFFLGGQVKVDGRARSAPPPTPRPAREGHVVQHDVAMCVSRTLSPDRRCYQTEGGDGRCWLVGEEVGLRGGP